MRLTKRHILRPRDAAFVLQLSVRAVNKMRIDGRGPKFIKIGRHVRYAPRDLGIWLQAQHQKVREDFSIKCII